MYGVPDLVLGAAAGALVGFLAGVTVDDALDLLLQDMRKRKRTVTRPTTTSSPRGRRGPTARRVLVWLLAGTVLINMALGLLLIQQRTKSEDTSRRVVAVTADVRTLAECLAEYQTTFGEVYVARATAAAEASAALDRLVYAVEAGTPGRFERSLDNYLQVRRDQERERQRNPLPEPPTEACAVP